MGTRGPVPKADDQRTRRNKTFEDGQALKKGQATKVIWRKANPDWQPEVRRLYNSFKQSGFYAYMQQTDVEWIYLSCDEMNNYRVNGGSAVKFQSILSMFNTGLGITAGDRLRMHVELTLPEPEVEDELDIKRRELRDSMRKKAS